MRGSPGVLFGEEGKAAVSGRRRRSRLEWRSRNGLVSTKNHGVGYVLLSVSEQLRTELPEKL